MSPAKSPIQYIGQLVVHFLIDGPVRFAIVPGSPVLHKDQLIRRIKLLRIESLVDGAVDPQAIRGAIKARR